MPSKGLVYLYDSDTNLPISTRKYQDRVNRREIINNWKKLYAAAFYRCYIVISPELTENYDYDAMEKMLDKVVPKNKKINIKRNKTENKSIYNTTPLYKYD
jgi:hypothetical protein